ncbi:MAG TPA: ABC transporter substrate-binding protein, partial [Solirubrobacterales bacterium]
MLIIGALMVCALLAGCGSDSSSTSSERSGSEEGSVDDSAGVTAKTIKIGVHGPKTGPAATLVADVFGGFEQYVDKVNGEGGVNGRKLE